MAWVGREAAAAGFGGVARVEPQKVSDRSVVLRIVTRADSLIFKAGAGLAHHEAPLTAYLSRRHPAHVPAVVAFDTDRRWMLMRQVRGPTLMSTPLVSGWQGAFETLGRIQCDLSGAVDDLFELGCYQRTLSSLTRYLDAFIPQWCAREDVTDAERRRLADAAAIWTQLCRQPIPGLPAATLDHADLHPRNIVVSTSGPVYLDWEGGAIGHPFWSPLILLGYVERFVPDVAGARDELRAAYLRPWTAFLPMTDLIRAFEQVRPLASLKYAFGLWWFLTYGEPGPERDALQKTIRACLESALSATETVP